MSQQQQQQQQQPPSNNQEEEEKEKGREITGTQEDTDQKQKELDDELQEVSHHVWFVFLVWWECLCTMYVMYM